jgi:hypothetical protein
MLLMRMGQPIVRLLGSAKSDWQEKVRVRDC